MVVSDLVIEILFRLPPEPLLRFQSVSKSWYALINDSKFVMKHLSNSLPFKYVLLKRLIKNNFGKKELVLSILKFSVDRSLSFFNIHFPFLEDNLFLEICGHSHGLVCLTNLNDIFLCNPMTRQFHKLPPSILIPRSHDPSEYDALPPTVGFGYDTKSRDFKVLRIVTPWEGVASYPSRAEIYDLSKDRWREIETPFCGDINSKPSFEMSHKGTLIYWYASKFHQEIDLILTFDMSEEIFGEIPIMENYNRLGKFINLWNLNGSMVFSICPYTSNDQTLVFDIWKMEKDEFAVVSWSKILTIGPIFGIRYPLLLFVSSDELLMESKEDQLVSYNCNTQQIKELPIKGEIVYWRDEEVNGLLEATFFTKSLLSVSNISYEI